MLLREDTENSLSSNPNIDVAEDVIALAIAAHRDAAGDDTQLHAALDALPGALYITDGDGQLTYYNRAAASFAGREPILRQDRWCVTWKLFTADGEPLPHDQCPMAVALQSRRGVRGAEAIAERPDGSRVHFTPYPTPLFDAHGVCVGAVNLLIDITERRHADNLRRQAAQCLRLAKTVGDRRTEETLRAMAEEYQAQVSLLERPN